MVDTWEFQIIISVSDVCKQDEYESKLYEAGCSDATMGSGVEGFISLLFDREESSQIKAIVSAINDIEKAIPNAIIVKLCR